MKILLTIHPVKSGPHVFAERHLRALKKVAPDYNIVVSANPAETKREAQSADIIAGFPNTIPDIHQGMPVRWLHSFSAGVDRVLTEFIKNNDNIVVSNSSGIHATPIAEHVLCFMLMHVRRSIQTYKNQKRKLWQKDESITELRGKTVLVVGVGHIGGEVARLAAAFGCRVLGVVRHIEEKPEYVEKFFTSERIGDALPEADFVCVCLPGGPQTKHYFDMAKFSQMKRSAVLINIGRCTIVKQDDLIKALQDGVIGAAMLDVTDPEPLPVESPLWSMDNVVITPHHSGLSEKYMDRAIEQLCRNLDAFRKGEPLPNRVDKARGY